MYIINEKGLNLLRESIERLKSGGKIHIKKSHRGLFTKKAKAAKMGVQEYARHVLANKEDFNSGTVKQANFARNAASWG